MKFKIEFVIWILILGTSCEKEITNPFDPNCPKEIWTPSEFKVNQADISLTLTWKQENTNISGFKIERRLGDQEWSNVASPGKTATSWSDNVITGGEEHQYRLSAYAGDYQSNSVYTSITPVLKPDAEILPTTNETSNSAQLNGQINANGDPTSVTFHYGITDDYGNTVTAQPSPVTGNGIIVSAIVSGLAGNKLYYFKIIATNTKGTEEKTGTFSTSPTGDPNSRGPISN